jgi:ferredoxin
MNKKVIRARRLELFKKQTMINNEHCVGCESNELVGNRNPFCVKECPIGKQIRVIGEELIQLSLLRRGETLELASKARFLELIEQEYTLEQIADIFLMSPSNLFKHRKKWGLAKPLKRRR